MADDQREDQRTKLIWAAALLSVFPVAWLFKGLILSDSIPTCVFRIVTSKQCPFCGLTRAFAHAAGGEFGEAQQCNPLWFLAMLVILVFAGTLTIDGLTGSNMYGVVRRGLDRLLIPIVIGLAVFGVWRIVGG